MRMKFVQGKAGNAQSWSPVRLGTARGPAVRSMPAHRSLVLLALAGLLALPAGARASDPLLSGYAGPGGGEQVVLGAKTVGKDKNTPSGGAGVAATATQSLRAPATPSAPAATATSSPNITYKPQRKKSSSPASQQKDDDGSTSTSTSSATTTATATTLAGAPAVVAYPTRDGAVGGLPVSAGGVLLVVLGLGALVLAVLGLRRVSAADHPPRQPQVSAS
jgi:hypothetical protein